MGILCIAATVVLVCLSFLSPHPSLLRTRQLSALPLLFAASTAFIFCLSTVSASGLLSTCDADFAGRYATPLLLALPFFFATIFTAISMHIHEKSELVGADLSRPSPIYRPLTWVGFYEHGDDGDKCPNGDIGDIGDKCPNGDNGDNGDKSPSTRASSLGGRFPLQPTSLRPNEHDNLLPQNLPLREGRVRYTVLSTILFAFLSVYLGVHVATYGLTDTAATFQSPFCLEAPANNDPIIAYMQHEHIRYAWAANLLAYPIVFKTNASIIIANPLALTKPPLAINRIPAYTAAVQHADRPSILIFAQHNEPHPALLTMLDKQQVTYQVARFPSEPGIDVLVVTPLNRTVSPFASNAFNGFFICGE